MLCPIADCEHSNVFGHEKGGVFESRIFGHVASHDFGFAFGDIKRRRFDSTKPETKNKTNAVAPHGVKTNQCGTKRVSSCLECRQFCRDSTRRRSSRLKHGDDERQFVADHLRDRAHRAEHGKLVVATPAAMNTASSVVDPTAKKNRMRHR